jgi:hypothetical protein
MRLRVLRDFYLINGESCDSVVLTRHFRGSAPPLSLRRITTDLLFGAGSRLKRLLSCGGLS